MARRADPAAHRSPTIRPDDDPATDPPAHGPVRRHVPAIEGASAAIDHVHRSAWRSSSRGPPDPESHRPRQRPGPQARQPVPAHRSVRRHPLGFARPRALPLRHPDAVLLLAPGQRHTPGPAPGLDGRELPRLDQLTNPSADRNPYAKMHPRPRPRPAGRSESRGPADRPRPGWRSTSGSSTMPRASSRAGRARAGRGRRRHLRGPRLPSRPAGTLLPIALTHDRVTFRYDGLDGRRRRPTSRSARRPSPSGRSTPAPTTSC